MRYRVVVQIFREGGLANVVDREFEFHESSWKVADVVYGQTLWLASTEREVATEAILAVVLSDNARQVVERG